MPASEASITYNILLMPRGGGHYLKAEQIIMTAPPERGAMLDFARDGQTVSAIVDHIHVPPGCEEHCIGTIFVHES